MIQKRPRERLVETNHKSTKNTVLGLDCSTATIGWGLITLEERPILLKYGHIKPMESKHGLLIERLDNTFDRIVALCEELSPNVVAVEEIKKFMKGRSSAQTITILAGFNRVVSLAAFKYTRDVRFYSESEVRKIIKNKYMRKSDKISKDDMPNVIRKYLYESFQGPLNTRGEISVETNDEADGIATGWCCVLDMLRKIK